jgi:hypothetical protein
MSLRRRPSFQDRLAAFAQTAREKAAQLPPGSARNEMIRKADQASTAFDLDSWAKELFSELGAK